MPQKYTDPSSGRPVVDFSKEEVAAHLGMPISRSSKRAMARQQQNSGKGDTPRPMGNKMQFDESYYRSFGCNRPDLCPCDRPDCRRRWKEEKEGKKIDG